MRRLHILVTAGLWCLVVACTPVEIPNTLPGSATSGDCISSSLGNISNGLQVLAFQSQSVAYGQACVQELRTCTDGVLSGSYSFASCSVAPVSSCLTPSGGMLANGQSQTFYQANSVAYGQSCTSQLRTCTNGVLSGSYINQSCSFAAANSCMLPGGGTLASGQSRTLYQTGRVAFGETCVSQNRTCSNGNLSGTYTNLTCTVDSQSNPPPSSEVNAPVDIPALRYLPASLGPRFVNGVEEAKNCEAPAGNKCIYVDSNATDGGSGTLASPYNSFENVNTSLRGGDYIYLTGTFVADNSTTKVKRLILGVNAIGPSPDKMTVVKSWPGKPRAHFKGQNVHGYLINFNIDGNLKNIRIANIEVSEAVARGISIGSAAGMIILEDLHIHHNQGDTGVGSPHAESLGVGGGVFVNGFDNGADVIVRNSYFERNNLLYAPDSNGIYRMIQIYRNNNGALSINSELTAAQGSAKFTVYNNIFNDEASAIRHKHAGNIVTEVYDNLIMNSERGVFIRSFKNNLIHHNVFYNLSGGAVHQYNENSKGPLTANFYNNNVFNSKVTSSMPYPAAHPATYNFYNNFFHSTRGDPVLEIGPALMSRNSLYENLFLTNSVTRFLYSTDGNQVNQYFDFSTFNFDHDNSNERHDSIRTSANDVDNHNAAYDLYLEKLKRDNIGAFLD